MRLDNLNQQEGAALLGITARTLRDWVDAPRNADGSYNGPQLVAYYVSKLGGDSEFDNQRERLAAAQAEKVEHENSIRRGQLADLSEVERKWTDALANVRARFLGMGSKLGPQLVNIADPSVIATAIRSEVRAGLYELADAGGPDDPAGVPDTDAPAGVNGKPVGGLGEAVKQRKQRRTRTVENG